MALITTYYLSPTDTRGARIKAKSAHDRPHTVTRPWDHAEGAEGNHRAAAKALATKMEWAGVWQNLGSLADGSMVWGTPTATAGFTTEGRH